MTVSGLGHGAGIFGIRANAPDADSDIVIDFALWKDELRFVQAIDSAYAAEEPLPLVTFGSKCFHGRVASALLDTAGIAYEEVLQSASIAGIRAAVSAGVGVALMNRGFMAEDQCTWPGAAAIATPPDIHYVLRAADTPLTDAQETLVAELRGSEMGIRNTAASASLDTC